MSNTVNTNIGAIAALASLRTTDSVLADAQKRVQTGYRVADAADDASVFSVAQGIRGNLQAYTAVQSSLANGTGLGGVTQAALTRISDLIGNIQAKITQLSDGSISAGQRTIYTADFNAMTAQISNFIAQANYNGQNLLSSASAAIGFLADTNASTITMASQSSVNAAFTAFAAAPVTSASAATLALTSLTTFSAAVGASMAQSASDTRTLRAQGQFVSNLTDASSLGLGAIVDADMGKAAAASQALQVKKQLGVQALSIANSEPQAILGFLR
ncbi:MAG: flagellin [Proteobacteria bacterium]|nr:flagellin [Pseudomonadota bacterium]